MEQKREAEELERRNKKIGSATTVTAVGDGYQKQFAAMQEADRLNSLALQNFQQRISRPTSDQYRKIHDKEVAN